MSNKQETLIYIEQENCTEAEFMSRNFVNRETKNRAYINALGAELVIKYLTSEGINTSNLHNLHSMSKILENIDIADILLPNIHLDVRVVFDETQIFIPKSHFEMDILPDAYVVLKLDKKFKHVELLGYFKPSQINKHNQNPEYYFFDKNKLYSPDALTKFVKDFIGKTSRNISDTDLLRGKELSISLADHNISVSEEKELLELLLLSDTLRESVLEFDNFETLSYSTAPVLTESLAIDIELNETPSDEIQNNKDNNNSTIIEDVIENEIETPVEEISLATMAMNEELNLDETFSENDFFEPTLVEEPNETSTSEEPETEEIEEISEDISEDTEYVEEEFTTEDDDADKTETEFLHELDFADTDNDIEIDMINTIDDLGEEETTETASNNAQDLIIENDFEFTGDESSEEIIEGEILTENIINDNEFEQTNSTNITESIQQNELLDDLNEDSLEFNEEFEIENISEPNIEEQENEEEVETLEEDSQDNEIQDKEETTELENIETLNIEEPILDIDQTDLGDDLLGGNLVDENNEIITPEIEAVTEEKEEEKVEENIEVKESVITGEEKYTPQAMAELSVDSILDKTIASISENTPQETEIDNTEKEEETIETPSLDEAATATASALAEAVTKAEEENAAASDEAIKLASVSGDMINDVVENLEVEQQKNLDKIDYAKTDITTEIDIPDHMIAVTDDLSLAKMEASLEAELSGEFGGPTDLTNLNKVEEYQEKHFEQESIDFGSMGTISQEELFTQGNENLDLDNLSNINIDMNGANKLPELNLNNEELEEGVVNLPQFNTDGFTINEDGSSPMDAMVDMSLDISEEEGKENLIDMDLGEETSPLNENDLDFSSCMKPSTRKREDNYSSEIDSKPTMDEATKQSLLANKITRESSDDEDFSSEDFGEAIVIEEEEPFTIDTPEIEQETSTNDEISLEDFMGEDELTEETFENIINSEDETQISDEQQIQTDDYQEQASKIQPEISTEQQDWMSDIDYTNLEDIEIQNQENPEDFIVEPSEEEKTYAVAENSTVISDKTFKTGEIPIDINAQNNPIFEGEDSLASIYNSDSKVPGGAMLQTPGRMSNSDRQGRATAGILGIIGTLIVIVLVGAIGFGVAKLFKAPTEEAPQPITDEPIPTSSDNGVSEANTLKINPDNVVNMDSNTNALATTTTNSTQAKNQAPATVNSTTSQKKGQAKPFVSISKLTWSLPNYISNNPQFKQYFQSAGKSLKLSLTSDLLLATDYLYSNTMRVGVTFAKDGTFQNSQIITSSGSNQIDQIVLQTVNQVLKSLKAPSSVGNDENTPVTLNLYF